MLELMILEVGGAQRHHQVSYTDARPVRLSKNADHHVAIQHHPGHFRSVKYMEHLVENLGNS